MNIKLIIIRKKSCMVLCFESRNVSKWNMSFLHKTARIGLVFYDDHRGRAIAMVTRVATFSPYTIFLAIELPYFLIVIDLHIMLKHNKILCRRRNVLFQT